MFSDLSVFFFLKGVIWKNIYIFKQLQKIIYMPVLLFSTHSKYLLVSHAPINELQGLPIFQVISISMPKVPGNIANPISLDYITDPSFLCFLITLQFNV